MTNEYEARIMHKQTHAGKYSALDVAALMMLVLVVSLFVGYSVMLSEKPPMLERPVIHILQIEGESSLMPLHFPSQVQGKISIASTITNVALIADGEKFGLIHEQVVYRTPALELNATSNYYVMTHKLLPPGDYNITVNLSYKLNCVKWVEQSFIFATVRVRSKEQLIALAEKLRIQVPKPPTQLININMRY